MKRLFNLPILFWVAAVIFGGMSVYSAYVDTTPHPHTANAPVCYESSGETVKPEFRASSSLVKVNWITGVVNVDGDDAVGYAKFLYDPETNATICELYIPMPEHVIGDSAMDTVGHELLHCLAGSFHQ